MKHVTRRQAREYVLQALFSYEFTQTKPAKDDILGTLKLIAPESEPSPGDEVILFIEDMINGTIDNMAHIDEIIQRRSKNWDIERLACVDRNILRFAVYEILYRNDIPRNVSINEAVELAKKYSTQDSYSFINGILDKIQKP